MLALSAEAPPEGERWAYEIKWDGVRAITYIDEQTVGVRALSRNNKELTPSFPELTEVARLFGAHTVVLDGELVALSAEGRPSFSAIQQRLHITDFEQVVRRRRAVPVTYLVFDVVFLDGRLLLDLDYDERRSILSGLDPFASPSHAARVVRMSESFRGVRGADLMAVARERGLEGILAKDRASPYRPGRRSGEWLKIKVERTQEVVIGGWTDGKGGRANDFGALLLGLPDGEGRLTYSGKVGTGFSDSVRRDLLARLAPLEQASSPFSAPLAPPESAGAHFVRPDLVGEVRYGEWTPDGRLRHPVWRGLRTDKDPGDVQLEP